MAIRNNLQLGLMRRSLLLVIGLLSFALAAMPVQAAVCTGVELAQPAEGAAVASNATFRWSAEWSATARRELVLIGVTQNADGSVASSGEAAREDALPFKHKPKSRLKPGSYNWFVVFYDAKGNIVCTSPVGSFSVGSARRAGAGPTESLASSGDAVTVVVRGNFIVVLFGSPYLADPNNGFNVLLADGEHDYDASGLDLSRYSGVTIHGNDLPNTLTGSAGADIIFGYGSNDVLNGGDGDDELNGGNESCVGFVCVQNNYWGDERGLGDTLNGGGGDDTLNGGDESCIEEFCNSAMTIGDRLDGGSGSDTLNGGNESCVGSYCNFHGRIGDTLDGGSGSDILNGGNESCVGVVCNNEGRIGDALNGGPDDDILNGGNESCDGLNCNIAGGIIGDALDGGLGDDTGTGGSETDNGSGGGTVGDTIAADPGGGTDTIAP